jgi:transposase
MANPKTMTDAALKAIIEKARSEKPKGVLRLDEAGPQLIEAAKALAKKDYTIDEIVTKLMEFGVEYPKPDVRKIVREALAPKK